MTDVNDIYTSNYLKADDLQGREVTVIIDRIEEVEMNEGKKLCAYFRNKQKGMVLNKTNAMNIAALYGHRTEGWIGKPIIIGMSWVDFQGQSKKALRVRPEIPQVNSGVDPQAPPGHRPQQQAAPDHPNTPGASRYGDMDDEVPFSPQVLG